MNPKTGINVRVSPALLQDRREVLTATSTRVTRTLGRGSDLAISLAFGRTPLSVALECMTSNVSR